ncbi:MAG TPA: hypothetical protein VK031_02990 [Tissierellaceae bacterium]|nr:hypothetical protein [Tissierellaceae bacterium]
MIYKIIAVYLISVVLPLLVIGKQKETLKLEGDYYPLVYLSFFPFVNSVFLASLVVSYVCFKLSDFIVFLQTHRSNNRKLLEDLIEYVKKENISGHLDMKLDEYYTTKILTVYEDGEVRLNMVNIKNSLNRRQGRKLFKEMKKGFREQEGYTEENKVREEREAIEKFYKERINEN